MFENSLGIFSFIGVSRDYFPIGLRQEETEGTTFIIASPEKALCDLICYTSGVNLRYQKEAQAFLEEDLRLDMDFTLLPGQHLGLLTKIPSSELFEGPGQLVRAACATAFAVYAFKAGNDLLLIHSHTQDGKALGVAMAAFCVLDAADCVAVQFDVYLLGTYHLASAEGGLADSVFSGV